jgi:outer membrane receptor protein involved in Fe transport
MKKSLAYGSLLLLSSALVAPAAVAQSSGQSASPSAAGNTPPAQTPPATDAQPGQPGDASAPGLEQEQEIQVSAPGIDPDEGGEIVVVGRNIPNVIRSTPEVISVLSSEDIARTGEGDIAGALQRVTGLSVVGSGFVFVRGLGDRYSLALLNGSPLPSPEPLRRVVPLDIFPTSVIASAVVQKSYSVNYPGEFGGGVINLTTVSSPREPFLTLGASVGIDGETTGKLGYTYFGSDLDPLGFDDGSRDFPRALRNAVTSGNFGSTSAAERRDFAASLRNADTTLLQRNRDIPANFSAELSGGTTFELGGGRLGVVAGAGYSNTWRTRDALQQTSLDPRVAGTPQTSFRRVTTDNRIIVNGLLGLGLEFGEHELRWTNLYIRDTLKQGRLAAGFNRNVQDQDENLPPSLIEQNTYWFERQLIDTQLVGEFKFDDLSIDLRGTYANTQRESPYERDIGYAYLGDNNPATKGVGDVDDYINNLASGGQFATVAFSDLSEDVYAGAVDLGYRFRGSLPLTLSAGYAYTDNQRTSSRYQFQYFRPEGALPLGPAQTRPDFLLSDFNVYTYNIQLRDVSGQEGAAAYDADLRIHAGYGQAEVEYPDAGLRAQFGVRYETAKQTVTPIGATLTGTRLSNDYWLPAATITLNFAQNMQFRLHGSKTLARPQFRELAPQIFQDFESDREFTGNPFLTDSELFNAEARYEWYFARGQRVSLAGFYKKIDNPIEAAAFFAGGGQLRTGFANAPEAQLYGAEFEIQAFYPLASIASFLETKRLLFIGNYTYTQSKLKVDDSQIIGPDLQPIAANLLFRDGAPLNGQSDHLANVQIGIEDTDRLSQATLLFSYASKRVTNRGPIQGELRQPDIIEKPGLRIDFVAREEFPLFGATAELKFEARNLLGRDYEEYQAFEDNRIEINSYDLGRTVSLGLSLKF